MLERRLFSAPYRLKPRLIRTRTAWQPWVGHVALKFNLTETAHAAQGKVHKDRSWQPFLSCLNGSGSSRPLSFGFYRRDFREIVLLLLALWLVASWVTEIIYSSCSPSMKPWGGKYKRRKVPFTWKFAWQLVGSLGHDVRSSVLFSCVTFCLCLRFLIFKVGAMILILPVSWSCCEK